MDKLLAGRIKNLGLEEPSADFTLKVMQSVAEQPAFEVKQKNYWWVLSLIPVLVGICWYFLLIFELTGYVSRFWTSIISGVQPYINAFASLTDQFKGIKVSPLLIVGFIAIIMLLTIEELFSKAKRTP
jgi:hypothetical protein